MQNEAGSETKSLYAFGPFRLDLRERRLLNAGAPVSVPIKLFDLLAALVSAPGHLRSRNELVETVWPRTIVEEHSLTSRISALRKVLGDEGETPAYIETVRGVGYRFIAEVRVTEERADEAPAPASSRRRPLLPYLVGAALTAAALAFAALRPSPPASVAPARSIAVLPFANLGGNASEDYFVDGMQSMILTRLAGIRDMRVIARASTARMPSHPDDLGAIARTLNVASILEGSVQREGDQVLVNVQLVDAASGVTQWAHAYSRRWNNVLDIENDVAAEIATALNGRLESREAALLQTVPTHDAKAYDLFLKAEHAALRVEEGGETSRALYDEATAAYRQAIALDPDFALAHARLAFLMSFAAWFGVDTTPHLIDQAETEARAALRADIAQAHLAMGYVHYWGKRDFARAQEEFAVAERELPSSAAAKGAIAFIARRRGNFRDALAGLEQAELIDPRNSLWFAERGTTLAALGRYVEAIAEFDHALSIDPGNVRNRVSGAMARAYAGDVEAGYAMVEKIPFDADTSGVAGIAQVRLALWRRQPDRALAAIQGPGTDWWEEISRSSAPAFLLRARAWSAKGEVAKATSEYEGARALLQALIDERPENFNARTELAEADAGLGRLAEARDVAARAEELMPADAITAASVTASLAEVHARLGDVAKAVELLTRLAHMPSGNVVSAASLAGEPCWDPIRSDPRFAEVMAEYASSATRRPDLVAQ